MDGSYSRLAVISNGHSVYLIVDCPVSTSPTTNRRTLLGETRSKQRSQKRDCKAHVDIITTGILSRTIKAATS